MSTKSQQPASIWRQCVVAGMIAAGLSVAAGAASAGEMPARQASGGRPGSEARPERPDGRNRHGAGVDRPVNGAACAAGSIAPASRTPRGAGRHRALA